MGVGVCVCFHFLLSLYCVFCTGVYSIPVIVFVCGGTRSGFLYVHASVLFGFTSPVAVDSVEHTSWFCPRRQEYWSGLPCPSPGDLHDPGMEPLHLPSPALTGRSFTTSTKKRVNYMTSKILSDSEIPLTYNCLAHRKHIHTGSLGEK